MSAVLEFLDIFVKLFVVIDPFGSLVLFVAMAGTMDAKTQKRITMDATLYGGMILILFAVIGSYILLYFGISIEALEIAGGTILLIMGIEMVREGDRPKSMGGNALDTDIGIVPFATPFIAGPGAISLVIILMKGTLLTEIFVIASVIILMVIIYLFFIYASVISKLMGEKVMKALTRIFGLLVAAFAVQFFINALISLNVIR
ncbi:MAG TPA: MarC family protein [Thermoplasmataceae archaeon]|nr:MarC family protein [Thermoplasmatales archaeon AK]HLH85510.1 MarC family protein [Thermoplasmataceae archaeon]